MSIQRTKALEKKYNHVNKDLEQFYVAYAPMVYGCIRQLVADEKIAAIILEEVFVTLSRDASLMHAAERSTFHLLRFSSCFTLQQLKELNLQPLPGKTNSDRLLIDWLCTDCDSLESLMHRTGLNKTNVREQFHAQFATLRVKQAVTDI